jgi:hypothetical protein
MHFRNENNGFIAILERVNKGFSTIIFKTLDGGKVWIMINEIPEMILNLETINDQLWGSGHNVILKNIDHKDWEYEFRDTTGKVGQIRDIHQLKNSILAVSFNGYILTKTKEGWTSKRITSNRLRSIDGDNSLIIAAGDNNREQGNLFISEDKGASWEKSTMDLQDVHRVVYKNSVFWIIGKKDQLLILKN